MRQALEPFAQQAIDLACRKFVAYPLHQLGVGTGLDAVVQSLERHPTLGKLPLEILMAVDARGTPRSRAAPALGGLEALSDMNYYKER